MDALKGETRSSDDVFISYMRRCQRKTETRADTELIQRKRKDELSVISITLLHATVIQTKPSFTRFHHQTINLHQTLCSCLELLNSWMLTNALQSNNDRQKSLLLETKRKDG